jgi:hypothetical protein
MLPLFRFVATCSFLYFVQAARQHARENPVGGDLTNAFDLAVCVILGLAAAVTWAPYFGEKLSAPITGQMTNGSFADRRKWGLAAIHWLENRKCRRLALCLSFIEGVRRPWSPAPFVLGLRNSLEGTWLQKIFAQEVFKFDNSRNCVDAFRILEKHGIDPRPHHNPHINLILMSINKPVPEDREALHVPVSDAPPPISRDRRIKLF